MFKNLMGTKKIQCLHIQQIEYINKKIKSIKRDQTEILKLKSIIIEMKNQQIKVTRRTTEIRSIKLSSLKSRKKKNEGK